jgi:AcrR family transcriptional regulator
MARIAGVTRDQTRDRLLASAAEVFARRGFDGATVAEIADGAGLSTGAIYGLFGSKAGLFAATVEARAATELDRWLRPGDGGAGGEGGLTGMLRARGEALNRRIERDGTLLVQAILAGRESPDLVAELRNALAVREHRLAELLELAQDAGELTSGVPATAAVRFLAMLGFGATLLGVLGAEPVPDDQWSALVRWLVDAARPAPAAAGGDGGDGTDGPGGGER